MLKEWQGRPVSEWAEIWSVPSLEIYRSISSTNDRLIDLAKTGPASFTVVIADEQTGGRGRTGKKWYSPDGAGLLMSVLLPASSVPQPFAPLRVGVAVARAIEVLADGFSTQIKWPNDVLLDGDKVAGILCELAGEWIVTGIGVNIRTPVDGFPPEFAGRTSSLQETCQLTLAPSYVAEALISELHKIKPVFDDPRYLNQVPPELHQELSSRDALLGSEVTTEHEGDGVARGIDEKGALILEREDSSRVPVSSGSVILI